MSYKNTKRNKVYLNSKDEEGFVLLFAVVLTGLILTMTMGIANLTLKELVFSTSVRDGSDAFFAADAGIECATFQDKLGNDKFPRIGPAVSFSCFGSTINPTYTVPGVNTGQYDFTLTGLNSNALGCAKVTVFKDNNIPPERVVITSRGYNVDCASVSKNKSERRLQFSSSPPIINVALASNGGVASASSEYNSNYASAHAINDGRMGLPWGGGCGSVGCGWTDSTSEAFPFANDWLQVKFNNPKTINRIDVFSVQDTPGGSFAGWVDPTSNPSLTFNNTPPYPNASSHGLIDFQVQYSTTGGAPWTTVPGGNISNNNLIFKSISFAAISNVTDIRVLVTKSADTYSGIVELSAWTP
ncbi:hypothetical protein HZA26_01935 [Candidatus Nomurabacteria bacterium]|nr:hypothetical protein [Candidatus Nomurabacteria bacterium]